MVTKLQLLRRLKFYSKPYGKQWKWRYQNSGYLLEKPLHIPKALENKKIIDPMYPEPKPRENWIPPARHPLLDSFFPQPTICDHPHYNETPIKRFDRTIEFHAGIDQVCLLTKTIAADKQQLPVKIIDLHKQFDTTTSNDLVQNYIRQSLAFTPNKEKCPGVKIPSEPKFTLRREYSTPFEQQSKILLSNMLRLCNTYIYAKYPNRALNTKLMENTPLRTIFQRGDDQIDIRRINDFVLYSTLKLNSVDNRTSIDETVDKKFINMYPIFPTIDLKEEHVYEPDEMNTIGWKANLRLNDPYQNVHTLFHINNEITMSTETDLARLFMFAFGCAYAQSNRLLKLNKLELDANGVLKDPIVVNAVSMINERFNFVTFQLNTMEYNNNTGVKNLVYLDGDNEIYSNRPSIHTLPYLSHKNVQRLALRHLNYNPNVFNKLLSIVAYNSADRVAKAN